jgi:hypothetical protein
MSIPHSDIHIEFETENSCNWSCCLTCWPFRSVTTVSPTVSQKVNAAVEKVLEERENRALGGTGQHVYYKVRIKKTPKEEI